jgi:hypothetical protein
MRTLTSALLAVGAILTAAVPGGNNSTTTPAPVSLDAYHGLKQAGANVPKAALPAEAVAKNVLANPRIDGGLAVIGKSRGMTSKQWGMSSACHKMVRKNRLIARGISAQRI